MRTSFCILQTTYPISEQCIFPTYVNSMPISFTCTFTSTYRTTSTSARFNFKNIAVCARQKGRIKARSELNTVGDDKDTTDKPSPNNKARAALEQLDSELSALAEKKVSKDRNADYLLTDKEKAFKKAGIGEIDWPEITPGFLAFIGIGLLLLTLVNNILYNTFIDSPTNRKRSGPYVFDAPESRVGYEVELPEAPTLANEI